MQNFGEDDRLRVKCNLLNESRRYKAVRRIAKENADVRTSTSVKRGAEPKKEDNPDGG